MNGPKLKPSPALIVNALHNFARPLGDGPLKILIEEAAECIQDLDALQYRERLGRERAERECKRHADLCVRMENLLTDALEYFEENMDVRDGADGRQLPNREMCFAQDIREILGE